MKTIRKFASIMLAFVMCLCMAMPAMAADTKATDTGSITVNDLVEGAKISAYQIAEGEYDDAGNFLGYKMLTSGGWTINADGSVSGGTTEEALASLFTQVSSNTPAGTATVDMGSTSATISGLPIGAYLIVVEQSESVVYNLMIGSVSYAVDENGNWVIDNGAIEVNGDNLWAKSTTPTIEKTETGGSLDDYEHGGSADVGDTLTYHITVENIPKYDGAYPEFYVVDTINSELTITDPELSALKVTIGDVTLVEDKDYTVERTTDGFKVDFVVNGSYTLNEYAGQTLVIEFQADVTTAAADADDHDNTADLFYTTTSYANGSEVKVEDKDHEYTFAAKLQKTGSDLDGAGLAGAEFTLYTDSACENEYKQNGTVIAVTSGEDGYFTFTGLEEGTYYMKETTAPVGYALNQTIYKIEITASYKEDGSIDTWSIAVTDIDGNAVNSSENSADTGAVINDTKLSTLPSTGGMGTTLFTIGGCILMIAAAAIVVVMRRRSANAQ